MAAFCDLIVVAMVVLGVAVDIGETAAHAPALLLIFYGFILLISIALCCL